MHRRALCKTPLKYPALEICRYLVNEGGTHINRGYRIGLSFRQCLRSMFQIHNETVNVWSHVLGYLPPLHTILRLVPNACSPSLRTHRPYSRPAAPTHRNPA